MAILYWSADTLFWELSIDHNMDVQYQVVGSDISKLATMCEISRWFPCTADGRSDRRTVTWLPKFLGWILPSP